MDDIRKNINKELTTLLKQFIDKTVIELTTNYHIGKVVNNNDPEKLDRVRIRVFGVYSNDIPDDDLPWALPDNNFAGSLVGSRIIPPNDALLNVRFSNDNIYEPIYTSKVIKKGKSPSTKDYPNVLTFFELDNGDSFTINRETSETIYKQSGGNTITMSKDGDFTIEQSNGTIFSLSKSGEIELKNKSAGINISASGSIIIDQATSIKLGKNATIPCPDLATCLVTGGPLAIGTLIPGSQIFVT